VAGRGATEGGGVLFGHNEDNDLDDIAGMVCVPRTGHAPGGWVLFDGGARIPQVDTTHAYWRLQMPGLDHSDTFVNEHGVAVASNSCPSREDAPELIEGGVGGPWLRRLVAERARTARQGVELVGSLVERFGYAASGRTLLICDAREGWLVALVHGRHWAAARVPDDEVAVLANTYTIRAIDPADIVNYLACPDLIAYAVARGWHESTPGPFDFAAVYADPGSHASPDNTCRQWSGLVRLTDGDVPAAESGRLPFAARAAAPLVPADLFAVLRDHYEGTHLYRPRPGEAGSPHDHPPSAICRSRTNSSSVLELRSQAPPLTATVWWLALWQPCSSPYVPFYPGARAVPAKLQLGDAPLGAAPAYGLFAALSRWVDRDFAGRMATVSAEWRACEREAAQAQPGREQEALALLPAQPDRAAASLSAWSTAVLDRCLERARALMDAP
jgi:dipeptidase